MGLEAVWDRSRKALERYLGLATLVVVGGVVFGLLPAWAAIPLIALMTVFVAATAERKPLWWRLLAPVHFLVALAAGAFVFFVLASSMSELVDTRDAGGLLPLVAFVSFAAGAIVWGAAMGLTSHLARRRSHRSSGGQRSL